MASEYSCIITKQALEISVQVPHFKKASVTTIPINAEGYDVAAFIKFFDKGKVNIPPHFLRSKEDAAGIDDTSKAEWLHGTPELVLSQLERLNLVDKSFVVLYDADWADTPTDHYSAAFENGCRVADTYCSSDDEIQGDAFLHIDIQHSEISYFRDYSDAAAEYIKSIFKPGLWRHQ